MQSASLIRPNVVAWAAMLGVALRLMRLDLPLPGSSRRSSLHGFSSRGQIKSSLLLRAGYGQGGTARAMRCCVSGAAEIVLAESGYWVHFGTVSA